MRILVVDDDPLVHKLLRKGLQSEGHTVDTAASGEEGLELVAGGLYDAAVVDLTMPGIDGLEVTRRLRAERNDLPILMLTGHSELDSRLAGFRAGVDDYLAKPFAFQELLARLSAITRRAQPQQGDDRLIVADLVLDRRTHTVARGGIPIKLAPREFAVLELLMRNPGHVLSRTVLLERIWEYSYDGFSNVVDTSIKRLRKAIDRGSRQPLIHTVHGLGYKIDPPQLSDPNPGSDPVGAQTALPASDLGPRAYRGSGSRSS
jgi:two-component system OmpR family response regulator